MDTNQETRIEAINLRTRRVNGFKILTVFSKEYGLLKLSGSKMGGRSEPFVHNVYWIKLGPSEIHNIKVTEFKGHFKQIIKDLDKMVYAWQFAELLEACSHFYEEKSEIIYNLFYETLSSLEEPNADYLLISNYFIWKLADSLGYKPNLRGCQKEYSDCHLNKTFNYEAWLDLEHGEISCNFCSQRPSSEHVKILPGVYSSLHTLENISNYEDYFTHASSRNEQAIEFVTKILQRYLQKHTEKRIKSMSVVLKKQ
ncbi:MAG: DNA repair protein RecO [Candidatus Caenarcaniphilales bacterium]|nr:DNA repair protein RecO [Candidatus Caenarcaniphilales bacterium]